ncbi:MAG: hypothetical protein PHC68_11615 [Syntrophorhabdaceae bacterium]|nr:hypothetical protein [Syntrophorhabdaceae bacterium]
MKAQLLINGGVVKDYDNVGPGQKEFNDTNAMYGDAIGAVGGMLELGSLVESVEIRKVKSKKVEE